MTVPSSARFFMMSGLHPPHALLILGFVVSVGVWTTVLSPAELDSALAMVLFIQMFLASTGFLVPARRGHFGSHREGGARREAAGRTGCGPLNGVADEWIGGERRRIRAGLPLEGFRLEPIVRRCAGGEGDSGAAIAVGGQVDGFRPLGCTAASPGRQAGSS